MEEFYGHIIQKGNFVFAIEKVDGIKVQVQIQVNRTVVEPIINIVDLTIIKNTLVLYEDRAMPENYQGFQLMMERLGELKFDIKSGLIYYIKKANKYENCYKFDNIVLNIQECCVCLNETKTKTPCGHALCWICFDKITKCPLCRECLKCYESDDE